MTVKLLAQQRLKRGVWDAKSDPLRNYSVFFEAREVLMIGKHGSLEDEDQDEGFFAAGTTRKKEVQVKDLTGCLRAADLLYWLFDTHWLPGMRTHVSSRWNPVKDDASLAEAFLQWSYLMPRRFLDKVLQMYLKPRLRREISDNWDPKDIEDKANLIENWLFPWRQLLSDKDLQGFFVQIKLKLTSALQDWVPSLEGDLAQTLLLPWRGLVEP